MKKLFIFIMLTFFWTGVGNAGPKEISFSDAGQIVVETEGRLSMNVNCGLDEILERGSLPSTTGNMFVLLSPNEWISFEKGKIVKYFCVEDSGSQCRAKIDGVAMLQSFSRRTRDGEYSTKIWGMEEKKHRLSPDSLRSIDGIPLKLSYAADQFTVERVW